MLSWTIRTRMAVLYSGILLFTLLSVELVTYLFVRHTLQSSLDDRLQNEIQWLDGLLEKRVSGEITPEKFEAVISDHSLLTPIKLFIQIHNPSGKIIYKSPNLGRDSLIFVPPRADELEVKTLTGAPGLTLRAVTLKRAAATICIGSPVERYATPLSLLFIIFLILTPAVVLISAAGGYALARVALRPIDAITRTARRITVENLNLKLPDPKAEDEVGRLTSTFNEMILRLRYALEQARQFPANVAHELRNSLTLIRSWLDEALVSDLNADQVRKMAASSLDEVNRMSNMVEALFVLSRADLENIRRDFKEVRLDELVAGLHWESVILGQVKRIRVTLKKLEVARILGDEKLLRQLFLNLIDNAIKYNRERGTIHLSLEKSNSGGSFPAGTVQLTITDSGIGIPPEEAERVFERFYRTKEARSIDGDGVGLGLAIVKWIVDVHGGTITVDSKPGGGSSFKVAFPLYSEG